MAHAAVSYPITTKKIPAEVCSLDGVNSVSKSTALSQKEQVDAQQIYPTP